MRFGYSKSEDYGPNTVVVRDFKSDPPGRVLCIVPREDVYEAEQIAQNLSDLLNEQESKK